MLMTCTAPWQRAVMAPGSPVCSWSSTVWNSGGRVVHHAASPYRWSSGTPLQYSVGRKNGLFQFTQTTLEQHFIKMAGLLWTKARKVISNGNVVYIGPIMKNSGGADFQAQSQKTIYNPQFDIPLTYSLIYFKLQKVSDLLQYPTVINAPRALSPAGHRPGQAAGINSHFSWWMSKCKWLPCRVSYIWNRYLQANAAGIRPTLAKSQSQWCVSCGIKHRSACISQLCGFSG